MRSRAEAPSKSFEGPANGDGGIVAAILILAGCFGFGLALQPQLTAFVFLGMATLVLALQLADVWQLLFVAMVLAFAFASSDAIAVSPTLRSIAVTALLVYSLARHPPVWPTAHSTRKGIFALSGFMLFSLSSAIWSEYPTIVLTGWLAVAIALVTALVVSLGRWRDRSLMVSDLLLILAVLTTLIAAGTVVDIVRSGIGHGIAGPFRNPNMLGVISALTLALGLGLKGEMGSSAGRLTYTVLTATLVLSQSRTSIAAMAASLLILWLWRLKATRLAFRITMAAGLVVLVATIAWTAPSLSSWELGSGVLSNELSAQLSGRDRVWIAAVQAWQEQPIIGHGFMAGETLFEARRGLASHGTTHTITHNGYLQVLLEVGGVGLALLASALIVMWRGATHRGPQGRPAPTRIVMLVGLIIQVGEANLFGVGSLFFILFWVSATAVAAANDSWTRPIARERPLVASTRLRCI